MMRIGLLVLAQLAVLLALTSAAEWIGMREWMRSDGIGLDDAVLFAAMLILFGAILPAGFSRWAIRRAMFLRVIAEPANASETWLVNAIQRHARLAGIKMPEVAVYNSSAMRAYAIGVDKDEALIAVSSSFLKKMDRREAEAMLAKKVMHVARGDMLIPIFFSLLVCWMLVRIQYGL